MTRADLRTRILERLADDGTAYSAQEVNDAIDEAQQFFVLLTLCLETTATFNLLPDKTFYRVRAYLPDFLRPLRLAVGSKHLRPSRLAEFDALNTGWQQATGTSPDRYAQLGFSFLAVMPQASGGAAAQLTYARSATPLTDDFQEPEIPEPLHEILIDGARYHLAIKEGGSQLARVKECLTRFLDEATKLGDFVRRRSAALRYDSMPFELARFDRSRLLSQAQEGKKS